MNYKKTLENLYKRILEVPTRFEDNSNGPYREYCPYCGDYAWYRGNEPIPTMRDIEHYPDCVWVEADKYTNPELYI